MPGSSGYDVNDAHAPCPWENVIHGMRASLNFFSFKEGRRASVRTCSGLRCVSAGPPDIRKQINGATIGRPQVVQAVDGRGDGAGEQGKP